MVFTYLRKMKEITTKIIAILLLASMFLLTSCEYENPIKISLNPEEYNSKNYPMVSPFPDKIPENATVVGYRWYTYANTIIDRYLELEFETEVECQEYLDFLINTASIKNEGQLNIKPQDDEWFLAVDNPYDSSFVDYFDKSRTTWNEGQYYVEFIIESSKDGQLSAKCNFSCISYSGSLRTIVITHCYGNRNSSFYVAPIYFERFSVPLQPVDRRFYVEYKNNSN